MLSPNWHILTLQTDDEIEETRGENDVGKGWEVRGLVGQALGSVDDENSGTCRGACWDWV